jgi:Flp pilus assembly protein TadG
MASIAPERYNSRRRRATDARRGERGVELIEFAFVLPILVVVFAGIADFGFMLRNYEVVTNAAREGARMAVKSGQTEASVAARVDAYMVASLGPTAADLTDTSVDPVSVPVGAGEEPIQAQAVTVTYTTGYFVLGPVISLIGASSANFGDVTLTAVCTMQAGA